MKKFQLPQILTQKHYREPSVFRPENLLREARRQKHLRECPVPEVCVLDPDGDLVTYLKRVGKAEKNECWACYHSGLYSYTLNGTEIGLIPCVVGASYAVLVAEQLFASGCELLISVTSAGNIAENSTSKRFALITEAIRDEGTSYHYLPADQPAVLSGSLLQRIRTKSKDADIPFFEARSWTTDAPYRETQSAIDAMEKEKVVCVEMEASALYAFAEKMQKEVICFAHLTNNMAQSEGDFEKGKEFGSLETIELISKTLELITRSKRQADS